MSLWIRVSLEENLDVFSFFPVEHAIQVPLDLWFDSLRTSLRLKHSVLILERPHSELPVFDRSKRLLAGADWCWLSPRGLSLISEAYINKPMDYSEFKIFLSHSK